MLKKLSALPRAKAMLPFVRMAYAQPSRYTWLDEAGEAHTVLQGEGGEQGDPLMPLLFSSGLHDALASLQARLQEGEYLFAFLDDVYAVVAPDRVRPVYDMLAEAVLEVAGIHLNEGKTRVWNRAGVAPPDIDRRLGRRRVERRWC